MGLHALRGQALFRRIISSGFRQGSRGTVVFWEHNGLEFNRYGIAIRKAVGNAVRRNRIRRWTREYLRSRESELRTGVDVVILVNRDECAGSYEDFTDHLTHVFDLSYLRSSQAREPGGQQRAGRQDHAHPGGDDDLLD